MKLLQKKTAVKPPTVLLDNKTAHTHFAEAYRTLRTNIHLSALKQNISSILVTSAGPGEGKTSITANLGWTVARQGKSVVLVDCDLRRPNLSRIINAGSARGITELIADVLGGDINDSIQAGYTLPDIITLIKLHKATGKLLVRNTTHTIKLFFLHGKPIDLAWPSCPEQSSLNMLLENNGVVTRKLFTTLQQDTNRIGIILKTAIIPIVHEKPEMQGIVTSHIMEALYQLTTMADSSFLFTELAEQQLDMETATFIDLPQLLDEVVLYRGVLPSIDKSIQKALVQVEENLAILPAGKIPPNPSELAGSAPLHFILSRLQHLYDFMIIDTPPLLPASDALLLAPHANGIIMTVKAAYMNRTMIGKALDQLKGTKTEFLGIVLNQVDIKRERYYKYNQKYYTDYYGKQGG
ncbi:MAG: tyrosine-protein kinase family protein [Candidatus Electrothrix sp. AW3_4]|nr:tyrosine-protein kinase family protein [Candidatus Electrothrix gigas]